jgi:hypothetical protein
LVDEGGGVRLCEGSEMSNKLGRFEILSDLAKSERSCVYKATDSEGGQTVALKAIGLEAFGELASAVMESVQEEAAASKVLASHNIALLHGVEEIEGKLCASMEYVQGNSVATMLARKEGFSIWDLQDIARQACQGLDHAHVRKVVHCSLEPAKIMVQWDGIVKLLGFGVSRSGMPTAQAAGVAPEILHYMSPEQLRGDPIDARSNLFSLGAILYEMVTERKAFEGEDAEQVRTAILEQMPVAVDQVNRKTHPALSAVIMKALAKSPEERYQSGQELVNDLEKCKASPAKVVGAKPAAAIAPKAEPVIAKAVAPPRKEAPAVAAKAAAAGAAAGWAGPEGNTPKTPYLEPTSKFVTTCVKATVEAATAEQEKMSAAVAEPEAPQVQGPHVQVPKINVDPMMDPSRPAGGKGVSFSEISELPPLKEVYVEPERVVEAAEPEAVDPVKAAVFRNAGPPEKPKAPPREIAKKAVDQITKTPPHLFIYSIGGAAAVILLIIGGIWYHIHSGESDDDSTPASEVAAQTAAPAAAATPSAPAAATPAPAQVEPEAPPVETAPAVSITPKINPKTNNKKKGKNVAAAPAIVAGQLSVDSMPQGAQIQVDGQAAGVTPFNLANLMPGQHTVTVSKPGFVTDTRTVDVGSGSRSAVSVQLAALAAAVSAHSDPAGAEIWMDGKDMGKVTPAQIQVDRPGNHTFVFKKQGYLDETASANLQVGQTFQLAPTLHALGNTDEIKFGGKFKKVFGGSDTAGMGSVSIHTQPKGAQIAVNNRIVDRMSPAEFYLNPGNYEIDITLTGFKSLHKVISVEKSGKVVIDENLDRE